MANFLFNKLLRPVVTATVAACTVVGGIGYNNNKYNNTAFQCEKKISNFKIIKAELLIPGRGEPIENGTVIIKGKKIVYAGCNDAVNIKLDENEIQQIIEAPVVMPGMWDCHVHFIGESDTPSGSLFDSFLKEHVATRAARCVAHAAKALDAGFTSVREVGGIGCHLAKLIEDKSIRGPKIYYAGQILSTTGGHGDEHDIPMEVCAAAGPDRNIGYLCDGVPECLKAVRLQIRNGASHIKICTSGGVMSKVDDPLHQQFSPEELNAIVQEAARSERIVAAHCHGKAGIKAALDAGCKTIEHGTYLDEDMAILMKEKDAILVPTRWIIESLLKIINKNDNEDTDLGMSAENNLETYQIRKLKEIANTHMNGMRIAHKIGVKIALGTDMFISSGWGFHGEECHYLEKMGLTPLEVIEAATANGCETLGKQAPLSGIIKAGYDADILILNENPLKNVSILGNAKKIKMVLKGGEIVKNTMIGKDSNDGSKNDDDDIGKAGKAFAFWNRA